MKRNTKGESNYRLYLFKPVGMRQFRVHKYIILLFNNSGKAVVLNV